MPNWELILQHDYSHANAFDRSMHGNNGFSSAPVETIGGIEGFSFNNPSATLSVPYSTVLSCMAGIKLEVKCYVKSVHNARLYRNFITGFGSFKLGMYAPGQLFASIYDGTKWFEVAQLDNAQVPTDKWITVTFEFTGIGKSLLSIEGVATKETMLDKILQVPGVGAGGIVVGWNPGIQGYVSDICVTSIRLWRILPDPLFMIMLKKKYSKFEKGDWSKIFKLLYGNKKKEEAFKEYTKRFDLSLMQLVHNLIAKRPKLQKELKQESSVYRQMLIRRVKDGKGSINNDFSVLADKMFAAISQEIPKQERITIIKDYAAWQKQNPVPDELLQARKVLTTADTEFGELLNSAAAAFHRNLLFDVQKEFWPKEVL